MRLIVARCEVRYWGRLHAVPPEALRPLTIKWLTVNAIDTVALATVHSGTSAAGSPSCVGPALSDREKPLVRAMDVFTATGVATGVLSAVQGACLGRQARRCRAG